MASDFVLINFFSYNNSVNFRKKCLILGSDNRLVEKEWSHCQVADSWGDFSPDICASHVIIIQLSIMPWPQTTKPQKEQNQ